MRDLLAVGMGMLATACVNDGTLGVQEVDQRFTIGIHEQVRVRGTHVLIFFDHVSGDSRCPVDVTCPWAGNAAAAFELSLDNAGLAPQPTVLNTSLDPRAVEMFGVEVRLERLRPQPSVATPIDPASYVAELLVTRSHP